MSVYRDLKHLTDDGNLHDRDYLEQHGLDRADVMTFCAEDAADTLRTLRLGLDEGIPSDVIDELENLQPDTKIALVGLLAMHEEVGLILGMRLIREVGR